MDASDVGNLVSTLESKSKPLVKSKSIPKIKPSIDHPEYLKHPVSDFLIDCLKWESKYGKTGPDVYFLPVMGGFLASAACGTLAAYLLHSDAPFASKAIVGTGLAAISLYSSFESLKIHIGFYDHLHGSTRLIEPRVPVKNFP